MVGFPEAPSTPPKQITSISVDDLMQDLLMPAAPRSKRFHHLPYDRICADCGTEKALPAISTAASSQRVESGRVTKHPSIPKLSTKPSIKCSLRVQFDDLPVTPEVMKPSTSPPRRPSAPRFHDFNLDFDEPPSTPGVMSEPSTPSTPHSCPDPGVKCGRCARIEQKSAKMARQLKARSSMLFASQVRGNQFTLFKS